MLPVNDDLTMGYSKWRDSMSLSDQGNFDNAALVLQAISEGALKEFALRDLALKILKTGDLVKAKEVAAMIQSKTVKRFTVFDIFMSENL